MKALHKAALTGAALLFYSAGAAAQLTNQGLFDQVVTEFATRATSWQSVVMNAARRAITHLLRAMTDVGALGNYHLNCRRRRSADQTDHLAQYLADTRANVARLTSRARP